MRRPILPIDSERDGHWLIDEPPSFHLVERLQFLHNSIETAWAIRHGVVDSGVEIRILGYRLRVSLQGDRVSVDIRRRWRRRAHARFTFKFNDMAQGTEPEATELNWQ